MIILAVFSYTFILLSGLKGEEISILPELAYVDDIVVGAQNTTKFFFTWNRFQGELPLLGSLTIPRYLQTLNLFRTAWFF